MNAAVLAVLVAGCGSSGSGSGHQGSQSGQSGQSAGGQAAALAGNDSSFPSAAALTRARAITKTMSLPQKVGQLLVATVPGTRASAGGARLVRQYHLGGVIYFGVNIRTADQVAGLSNGLQRAALAQPPELPLLIGTDQEGGIVSRLAGIATVFPNQMAAGAGRDPALLRQQEQVTGAQLRAVGINLDYAPVADVNTDPANPVIGLRSFGAEPALVSQLTSAAVAGFHAAGEAVTAKHFPGHGDTSVDSHTALPVVHHTLRQWWQIDAPPFQAAIRAGADQIMVGHISVPALDRSGLPASLSAKVVTGLLRERLGYRGVVVTDSLRMAAVRNGRSNAQVAVLAVRAGADQLLMPESIPVAYRALLAAVRDGRISMARLDESVTRVIALKAERGVLDHPLADAAKAASHENTPADRETAARLADRSITMVVNRSADGRRALPVKGRSVYLAGPAASALAPALRRALARAGGRLVRDPAAAQDIVVATLDAVTDPAQQRLVGQLAATGRPVVVAATGLPYDLGLFPRAAALLAAYSESGASLTALAKALTGELNPAGRLPVPVPGRDGKTAYPVGTCVRY